MGYARVPGVPRRHRVREEAEHVLQQQVRSDRDDEAPAQSAAPTDAKGVLRTMRGIATVRPAP